MDRLRYPTQFLKYSRFKYESTYSPRYASKNTPFPFYLLLYQKVGCLAPVIPLQTIYFPQFPTRMSNSHLKLKMFKIQISVLKLSLICSFHSYHYPSHWKLYPSICSGKKTFTLESPLSFLHIHIINKSYLLYIQSISRIQRFL